MPDSSQTVIVIPAWNEATTIGGVVESVLQYGTVVVVDDASTDQTGVIARRTGAVTVTHTINMGYDGALNSGLAKADELGAKFIVTFDADGQHSCDDLATIVKHLHSGAELVLGVRSTPARIAEKLFAFVTHRFCGLQDPLCGMKGYHISLYRAAGCFDSCRSFGSQLALFGLKTLDRRKIKSIPVAIHPRADKPRVGSCLRTNLSIAAALYRVITR